MTRSRLWSCWRVKASQHRVRSSFTLGGCTSTCEGERGWGCCSRGSSVGRKGAEPGPAGAELAPEPLGVPEKGCGSCQSPGPPYLLAGDEQRRHPQELEAICGHGRGGEEAVKDVDSQAESLEGQAEVPVHRDEPADQLAACLRCHLRQQERSQAGPGTGLPPPSSPLPHLRLTGKRLMRLEAALQPFVAAVPALPVVEESLQLLRALPQRRRHLRCPRLRPQSRAPRAEAGEATAAATPRGSRALPSRRGHHGGGGCAAVSRGRYLSGGAAQRSSRPPPSAPPPPPPALPGASSPKQNPQQGQKGTALPKRLAVHSRFPPV